MHIKNLHCMIEKFTECAKHEVECGIEKLDTKEMGEVADIIKDLCEAEYYAKISKAMDESEYGEDYDMLVRDNLYGSCNGHGCLLAVRDNICVLPLDHSYHSLHHILTRP